jgi:cytochrome c553
MTRPLLLLLVFALASPAVAAEPKADARFFESRIRPLLADNCFKCHGPDKQKSELRLDSAEAFRKGGISEEPLAVPGDPAKSLLLKVVRQVKGVPAMPPDKKLSDRDIADLARWVADGAVYPASANAPKADAAHWAFVPPGNPPLPNVKDAAWVKSPIDRFILAKLEEKGLRPSPAADKRMLIRRITFDLTGLPPTPEEVDAFVNDKSDDALAKLVDRLLESPAYGERWGRHWLDVARYADSNGLDENIAYGTAWRYRDYVIRSINADKPFDQFIREQIAGDLLSTPNDPQRHEMLIATGFLSLGPKVLAEVDEKKMEMDIVDEQLDTVGQAFMAITLGCARCHDHKFDPFTQEDYYSLAGVFVSTKTMEHFKKIARWHENLLASPVEAAKHEEHQKKVAKLNEAIKKLMPKTDEASKAELKKLKEELAAAEKNAPELPTAIGVTEAKASDIALLKRGNHLSPGKMMPRRFPKVLAGETQPSLPASESGRRQLAEWITRPDHPLTARVLVNRVWRWHFGQGIVKSVDNFGKLGEKPSHPELLDWLARRFVEDGWSIKKLHRMIVLSSTYQQSSRMDDLRLPVADLNNRQSKIGNHQFLDPDNRLLSRFHRRRLEAEEMRDALLAVSGRLDRTAGGPAITHVKNREFLFDHTSKDGTKYDSRRRSIYLPVIRNNLYDVFQLFDTTDATVSKGDRSTTTVATQALFYMNSDLVADSAAALADRLLSNELSDTARIEQLYRTAYGRSPTPKEAERVANAVAAFEQELQSRESDALKRRAKTWSLVCQAVLAANEFVYVD